MAANLAPIYLDDNRIRLQGDERPKVSKILEAGGKGSAGTYQVMQLKSQTDTDGRVLRPEDVIDRTQLGDAPVYLKLVDREDAQSERRGDDGHGKSGTSFGGGKNFERQGGQAGAGRTFQPDATGGDGLKGQRTEDAETGQAQQGHGRPGARQEGEAPRGSDRGAQPQPFTGMGQAQQSGQPKTIAEGQPEWRPGVPGTASTADAQEPSSLGKKPGHDKE